MQQTALPAVTLAALLLLSGCIGLDSAGTSPPIESPNGPGSTPMAGTPPTAETTRSATAASTPRRTAASTTETTAGPSTVVSTATPAPVGSIPSPAECLAETVPRPDPVDGVGPSTYPETPENVTRERLIDWTQAFEMASFRNEMLSKQSGNGDANLTEISISAEVRGVDHTARGYVVRLSPFAVAHYASGTLGERWTDVGYVVNETHVVRVSLDERGEPVRASQGTVVVGCT